MRADVVRDGLRQPVMWITWDADTMRLERRRSGGWSESAIHETLTSMRAVYERLPGARPDHPVRLSVTAPLEP